MAGNGVERLACSCARELIARLYHVWQVAPSVGSRVPRDRAVADDEVDVATGK